jgi:hypothetical protein
LDGRYGYIPELPVISLRDIDEHLNAPQSFYYLSEDMFVKALKIAGRKIT